MNKAQAAALLLAGATVGVGGKQLVESAISPAEAATILPFTHAVDLRRDYSTRDAGTVRISAYATRPSVDGGTRDVGLAQSCAPSAVTAKRLIEDMNTLARECNWP